MAQERVHDVIIIGAGLSGLSAAHFLNTDDVLILEKNAQAGGRVIGGEWNGFHYPKGTEYIGEPDGILKLLIEDLDLEIISIPPPTDGIGYKGEIYTKESILDFLPREEDKEQFMNLQRELAKMDRRTEDIIWALEEIDDYRYLDQVSVKQWLDEQKIHPLIQRYIEIENLGLFSANNEELSILFNANEMAYNLPDSKHYDESEVFTFPNGMIELSGALEKKFGTRIKYNSEVVSVDELEDGNMQVKVIVDGVNTIFKAKKVVCSTPAPIAKKLLRNCVSESALENLSKVNYGPYFTINLFTEKRWLSEAWTVSCLDSYFTSIYDVTRTQTASDYSGKSIISAYIPSHSAWDTTFIYQNDEEVFKRTIEDLEQYYPGISSTVIDYDVQRFKYAYPVFGLGYYGVLEELREDSSLNHSVFLAGDYMSYAVVDGAVLSGFQAAKKVNRKLKID